MRQMDEAQMHGDNCFVTLTYDPEHCPDDWSLKKRDLQLFLKRLRKDARCRVRFYGCGEYGEQYLRPHYHVNLFGLDFPDKRLFSVRDGNRLYTSEWLFRLWPYGHSLIGALTFDSAAYVARYVMKKVTGPAAEDAYWRGDPETGECWRVEPEWNTMSRRPGIGYAWYQRYRSDCYPSDVRHVRGQACKPPKYYDKQLAIEDPTVYDLLKARRVRQQKLNAADNTLDRLAVKEKVKKAAIRQLKRQVE